MNDLFKMAIRKLKRIRKHAMLLFGSLLVLSTILITILNIVSMNNHEAYIQNLQERGSYYYFIMSDEQKVKDELINSPLIKVLNYTETYSTFSNGKLGYLDGGDLLPFEIIEGQYPSKENEIALTEDTIENLQCENKIGSKVKIELDNGEIKEFNLSGIIKNSDFLPLQAYTTKQDHGYECNYYFKTYKHAYYYSDIQDIVAYENSVYANYQVNTLKSNLEMMGYSLIVSLLILSGLSMLHEDNVDDIVLYRGIGGTKRSVILYVFIQAFIICSLAIGISNLLAILFSVIYGLIQSINIYINFTMMIEIILVEFFAMVIGTIIPAIRLSQIDLTGGLKKKHRRVLFPKKRGRITSFTLASRFVLDHFSRYAFMIVLVIVALLMTHTNLNEFIKENDTGNELVIEYTYSYETIKNYLDSESKIKDYRCYAEINTEQTTYKDAFSNDNDPYQIINWYGSYEDGFGEYDGTVKLYVMDHISDKKDFVKGNGVMIYAPKVLVDYDYGYLYKEEYIKDKYPIIQNTNIKIGDYVKIEGIDYPVVDIIEDLGDYVSNVKPNTIIVSSSFLKNTKEKAIGVSRFNIQLIDNKNHSIVKQMILSKTTKDKITRVIDPFELKPFDVSSFIRFVSGIIIVVTMIIELIFTKQNERKERIAMLRSLGMTKQDVTKVFVLESMIIYVITAVAMVLTITVQNFMAYQLEPISNLLGSITFERLLSFSEMTSIICILTLYFVMLIGSCFIMIKMNYRKDYMNQIKNRE